MRIVYVLTSLGMGGAERQVLAIASRMADRGHAVALVVLRPQLIEEWPTSLEAVHLQIRKSPLSVIAGLMRGRRFLKRFRPDLIHSHCFHANIFARLLKIVVPAPIVLSTIHNVYEGGGVRMMAYRLTDGLSRRTTAVGQVVADRFVQLKAVPPRKCMVVTNGIDTAEFAPSAERRTRMRISMEAREDFVWITAGRIVPAKDFPNLLRAFEIVRSAHPDAQLWIAGEAVNEELKPVASFLFGGKKGSMDRVRWLGLRRDLPALLDAADGFVLSSAWEGMPLVVGEAMAMEKPVVATDVGGVRELMGEAGALVPAGDSDALAAAMIGIMKETQESRRRLGGAGRERIATQFSLNARADEWEELLVSLLAHSK